MIVVGVDPGLANCGVVALVDGELDYIAVHRSSPGKGKLKLTIAQRLHAHVELARYVHRADVLAIEVPSFPPGARPAALLFSSFGVWCGATSAACRILMYPTKKWRAAHGLPSRETTEERKADVKAVMDYRWPGAELAMVRAKVPRSCREHAYDALAMATVASESP